MRKPKSKYTTFGIWCESVVRPITEDGKKYYEIVFVQGNEAAEPLDILKEKGEDAALDYLKEYDYGKEMDVNPEDSPWGDDDEIFEKDGYVMSWNNKLGYIGLVREVKKEQPVVEPTPEEPIPQEEPAPAETPDGEPKQ